MFDEDVVFEFDKYILTDKIWATGKRPFQGEEIANGNSAGRPIRTLVLLEQLVHLGNCWGGWHNVQRNVPYKL